MRMRHGLAMAGLLLLGSAGTAYSKNLIEGPLARAKKAVAAKDVAGAAAAFGEGIVAAGKSLEDQETVTDALDRWMDTLEHDADPTADRNPGESPADVRKTLAGVMKALDPASSGASVSAHALAAELLADAVASGDTTHVLAAAAVLAAHAKVPKTGKGAAVLAQWGEGMRLASVKDAERADAALDAAAKAAQANGWFTVAACAATELAALRWKVKSMVNTSNALAIPLAMLDERSDKIAVQAWMHMVTKRMAGAPAEALGEYAKATASFERAASDGLSGAPGADANEGHLSDVGTFLAHAAPDRVFVTATRAKDGFTVQFAFRKAPAPTQRFGRGQQHYGDGGLTLAFADRAVALRLVDTGGGLAKPGERLRASRVRAFYLLAEGETFTVTRNGTVTITP